MPMPTLEGIVYLGQRLMENNDLAEKTCDRILEEYLDDEARRSEKVS